MSHLQVWDNDQRNSTQQNSTQQVMASLMRSFKGKVDLIDIDLPFDIGAVLFAILRSANATRTESKWHDLAKRDN